MIMWLGKAEAFRPIKTITYITADNWDLAKQYLKADPYHNIVQFRDEIYFLNQRGNIKKKDEAKYAWNLFLRKGLR